MWSASGVMSIGSSGSGPEIRSGRNSAMRYGMVRGVCSSSSSMVHQRCSPKAITSSASRPMGPCAEPSQRARWTHSSCSKRHPAKVNSTAWTHTHGPISASEMPASSQSSRRTASSVLSPGSMPPPGISHQPGPLRRAGSIALINRMRSWGSSTTTRAARRRGAPPLPNALDLSPPLSMAADTSSGHLAY